MKQLNLPVPTPVAAHIDKNGLMYRASLITEKLKGFEDLCTWLKRESLSREDWQAIGKTLALFHLHRIDHVDLNLKNILWNGQQAYLIDFDRCVQRSSHGRWIQSNLRRLKRSLLKASQQYSEFYWKPYDFTLLLSAHQNRSRSS